MEAIKMFEDLDHVHKVEIKETQITGYGNYTNYKITLYGSDTIRKIWFNGFNNSYSSDCDIRIEMHKAIHQQLIEIGWL